MCDIKTELIKILVFFKPGQHGVDFTLGLPLKSGLHAAVSDYATQACAKKR